MHTPSAFTLLCILASASCARIHLSAGAHPSGAIEIISADADDHALSPASHSDVDGDGVPDYTDECPHDPFKVSPGRCGCGMVDADSDLDGVPDCDDLCPDDRNKVEPGICGCGVSDTRDTDADGTVDCLDGCPSDARKTQAGQCGCGIRDVDSDHDGTPDCKDLCPLNGAKIRPGTCGCSASDEDSDGDGVPDCIDICPNDTSKSSRDDIVFCGCGESALQCALDKSHAVLLASCLLYLLAMRRRQVRRFTNQLFWPAQSRNPPDTLPSYTNQLKRKPSRRETDKENASPNVQLAGTALRKRRFGTVSYAGSSRATLRPLDSRANVAGNDSLC